MPKQSELRSCQRLKNCTKIPLNDTCNRRITFNVIQGHWYWCHSIGHEWFPLSLPLQLFLWLVPFSRYWNVVVKIVCDHVTSTMPNLGAVCHSKSALHTAYLCKKFLRFCHFCRAHSCDQQTDRHSTLDLEPEAASLHSTHAMQPSNISSSLSSWSITQSVYHIGRTIVHIT